MSQLAESFKRLRDSGKSLFTQYLLWIVFFVFSCELILEYRHYHLGYDTPILGSKNGNSVFENIDSVNLNNVVHYGPTENFPFRSLILTNKKTKPRIWIASASHAISDRIAPSKIFPNLICLETICEVINGSMNGMTIEGNINLLNIYSKEYAPDTAMLYQMSMFIANESVRLSRLNSIDGGGNNPIIDFKTVIEFLQRFSIYAHLSDLIGGNIKLRGQLKSSFPLDSLIKYEEKLLQYIVACRDLGIRPILSTFATSYDADNIEDMPLLQQTNFVKWVSQPYLSPKGWVKSVRQLNNIIRVVAKNENVQVIDIAMHLSGKPEYFVDYVHFNEMGHRIVADVIVEGLYENMIKGLN